MKPATNMVANAAANFTTHTKDPPAGDCTSTEHIGLAADLAVPLIKRAVSSAANSPLRKATANGS